MSYYSLPRIVSCVNSRQEVGQALQSKFQSAQYSLSEDLAQNEQVEICWGLPITKDKFRLRCLVKVLSISQEGMNDEDKELLN